MPGNSVKLKILTDVESGGADVRLTGTTEKSQSAHIIGKMPTTNVSLDKDEHVIFTNLKLRVTGDGIFANTTADTKVCSS